MGKLKRREFFKYGLLGGSFALMGELSSKSFSPDSYKNKNGFKHPWWVKEVDRPVVAIDDKVYKRFDAKNNVFGSFLKYIGKEKMVELRRIRRERTMKYYKEKRPGYRLEDRALADAAWVLSWTGGLNRGLRSWTRLFVRTPEERGIEKWKGSPEEAATLVKSAARYFGAATVGITLLDRRHIYSRERGMDIVFEDVDEPYEEEEKKIVIPSKCKYAIALTIQMSLDNIQCSPTAISSAGSSLGYSRAEF